MKHAYTPTPRFKTKCRFAVRFFACLYGIACLATSAAHAAPNSTKGFIRVGNSVVVSGAEGVHLRLTPYGNRMVRVQAIRNGEDYFKDDHYEMVQSHSDGGSFIASEDDSKLMLRLGSADGVRLNIDRTTLAISYFVARGKSPVLQEQGAVQWKDNLITRAFYFDPNEHFAGMGHDYFGRAQSIDLKGQAVSRNYGRDHVDQAPLLVPFYISSKGYGIFLNSTFRNHFDFGAEQRYEFGIDTLGYPGRLDYFFIAGPDPKDVLTHYVRLTGKPRLPRKAIFGLALSDKGHDHDSATPSDEIWWKDKITAHRAAGFPLDHVVNDNRWRAGGGKRCESYFAWDRLRYPDPPEYAAWLKRNGLVSTLDFNRCIARYSEGWRPEFNLPEVGAIDFGKSAPDLTSKEFRDWFWRIFYAKSLNPALKFPGDALWIDEFDEMGAAPEKMILSNGLSSAEMRNYWFFLIAKALVQQGWDHSDIDKRPFVWVRGMTAGAQRYATLWSGDIKPTFEEMKMQIRGMQLAGLSGFPFWGHDAGGFQGESRTGPDADLYMQWSMGFGSFSPIWKPHGVGASRWPLDRSAAEQVVAHQFSRIRYELMPYIYSAAHVAASTGLPMARAMLLEYPHEERAWQYDLQYMWGPDLLVAPHISTNHPQDVWLPPGTWLDFWHPQEPVQGDRVLSVKPTGEKLPVFVKAGAIIPRQAFALSTAFGDKSELLLDVYRGANGYTELIEDDDITEAYRRHDEMMTTSISYDDAGPTIRIAAAKGDYAGAPTQRSYQITLHGFTRDCFMVNGKRSNAVTTDQGRSARIAVRRMSIRKSIAIEACKSQ